MKACVRPCVCAGCAARTPLPPPAFYQVHTLWPSSNSACRVSQPPTDAAAPIADDNDRDTTHVLRVVCFKCLVGRRTGPLTFKLRSLARVMRSPQTAASVLFRYMPTLRCMPRTPAPRRSPPERRTTCAYIHVGQAAVTASSQSAQPCAALLPVATLAPSAPAVSRRHRHTSPPLTSARKHADLDSHFSRGLTFLEVKVMRILCTLAAGAPALSRSSFW
jgi:hypothetical protein